VDRRGRQLGHTLRLWYGQNISPFEIYVDWIISNKKINKL
jgi:hypothetical protein